MKDEEIKTTVLSLLKKIAPETEPESLAPTENIRQSLEIDSFDYLRFLVSIDEKFGIQTPEEDYGKIETLEKLVLYINQKTGVKSV